MVDLLAYQRRRLSGELPSGALGLPTLAPHTVALGHSPAVRALLAAWRRPVRGMKPGEA